MSFYIVAAERKPPVVGCFTHIRHFDDKDLAVSHAASFNDAEVVLVSGERSWLIRPGIPSLLIADHYYTLALYDAE